MPDDARRNPFDTVVMGWNTYALGLPAGVDSPYAHLRQVVFTRAHLRHPAPDGVELVGEDPASYVADLKTREGGDIWLCGGAVLAGALIGQVDRVVVKTYPVLLGAGLPLFACASSNHVGLDHLEHRWLAPGIAMNSYRVLR